MTSRVYAWQADGSSALAAAEERREAGAAFVSEDGARRISKAVSAPFIPRVTARLVDEAVEAELRDTATEIDTGEVMKALLSKDHNSGASHAYYTTKAAASRAAVRGVGKREVRVSYVLGDDDVIRLTEYVPEFNLVFHSREDHDHPMAAACRMLDNRLVQSRIPEGVTQTDVGGNPMHYVYTGNAGVHVCGADLDVKDSQRHVLRRAAAAKLLASESTSLRGILASRYLAGDSEFVCGKNAQKCNHRSRVLTSIHVYDIPMQDWPAIMEAKQATLVEGCILFSNKFFQHKVGELGMSRARYEIDPARDVFRMGFAGSPSWWYEHSWSDFMKYGVDQTMVGRDCSYSYKIVERRGDTLFFRILRVPSVSIDRNRHMTWNTPDVAVVHVQGFKLAPPERRSSTVVVKAEYDFPKTLWDELLAQASEDFEKGVMDYDRMYNHYRTISVRQTINAVLVMGGDKVSVEELVPLIVHVCMAAAAQCLLGQRGTRGLTDAAMYERLRSSEYTIEKVLSLLGSLFKAVGYLAVWPVFLMGSALKHTHSSILLDKLMAWEPVCEIKTIKASAMSVKAKAYWSQGLPDWGHDYGMDQAAENAGLDHFSAVMKKPELADILGCMFSDTCPVVKVDTESTLVAQSVGCDDGVSKSKVSRDGVDRRVVEDLHLTRVAAIVEHLEEVRMQNAATTDVCARAFREVFGGKGTPSVASLKRKSEVYHNPDCWFVSNGVVMRSALGMNLEDFSHSAVYSNVPDPDTGQLIRSVFRRDWKGERAPGEPVVHVNCVLADEKFTGWVLVVDELNIFNGPEIVSAMKKALKVRHDYDVSLHRGPPGCGKTYTIVREAKDDASDAVMCPVRESIADTRQQFCKLHPEFRLAKLFIRTVDSYLVNYSSHEPTRDMSVRRLLADECFMTHAGKWYAAAGLLGVEELHAYGDECQIPHIPRVQAPKLHVKLIADSDDWEWRTRRCPANAVAAWGHVYDWRVRSMSSVVGSMSEVKTSRGMTPPRGVVMMCMYQADKLTLRHLYAHCLSKVKIMTAHESEGKTFAHVWLHRFDARVRTDGASLFDKVPHVLVAMSRHTDSFVYVNPATVGGLPSDWIKKSKDPRRVAAAAHVSSAGTVREFM